LILPEHKDQIINALANRANDLAITNEALRAEVRTLGEKVAQYDAKTDELSDVRWNDQQIRPINPNTCAAPTDTPCY
jgi:hypothetical protein